MCHRRKHLLTLDLRFFFNDYSALVLLPHRRRRTRHRVPHHTQVAEQHHSLHQVRFFFLSGFLAFGVGAD